MIDFVIMSAPKGVRYPVSFTPTQWITGSIRASVRLPLIVLFLLIPWVLSLSLLPLKFLSYRKWTAIRRPVLSGCAWCMIRILGVRLTSLGDKPSVPFFLVANHMSWLDGPVFMAAVGAVFMVKHEIRTWPLIGSLMNSMGSIFIDKKNLKDLPFMIDRVQEVLGRGDGFMVFPEADTADGEREKICPFRPAMFQVPIQLDIPVHRAAIHYRTPPDWPPASRVVAWADWTPILVHAMRMLMVPSIHCVIRFLPPEDACPDRKEEAGKTQQLILHELELLRTRD